MEKVEGFVLKAVGARGSTEIVALDRRAGASANTWGRHLRALLNFAAGRYIDTEGRPILTGNTVKVLCRAHSWYRVDR